MYTKKVIETFKDPHNIGEIKNPDGLGKIGNPQCLPSNTLIHTNDSLISLNSVDKDAFVIGNNGFYNKVLRIMKRKYYGELIQIRNKLGAASLTPDHMVYAIKVSQTWWFSHYKNKKKLPLAWYHADELEKRDIIAYPILKEIKDIKYLLFKQRRKKWDHKSIKIPEKIPLSEDFLRLSGYYLAEGSLSKRISGTKVAFAFNTNEDHLANDVIYTIKKMFGIEPKKIVKEEKNTLIVEVNNVWFTRLFKSLFDKGASKKRIPHQLMLLDPEKQKNLIYGLWKGDGYFNLKKPGAGYATISRELCQQIKILLLRQKIVPSIYTEKEKLVKGVRHRRSYRIHIGERRSLKYLADILNIDFRCSKKIAIDSWFDENYLYMPITSTKKSTYSGYVHDLEVENARSYLTRSLTVHNCGDLMWVYIKVGKNKEGKEIIKDIKVKTFGCVAAIATSSVMTDLAKGKTLDEAYNISKDDIIKELGELPQVKVHCSVLSMDGLKKAIEDYFGKKKKHKKK